MNPPQNNAPLMPPSGGGCRPAAVSALGGFLFGAVLGGGIIGTLAWMKLAADARMMYERGDGGWTLWLALTSLPAAVMLTGLVGGVSGLIGAIACGLLGHRRGRVPIVARVGFALAVPAALLVLWLFLSDTTPLEDRTKPKKAGGTALSAPAPATVGKGT